MKKKLLSLVLAGAMVASTSVSAFAAVPSTKQEEVTISSGDTSQDVNVDITGNILDNNGNAVPGTIKVTVPTATTFNVTTGGVLNSAPMTIRNDGDEQIAVEVSRFEDSDGSANIDVIKKTEFDTNKAERERNQIWLRLKGGSKMVSFGSANRGQVYEVQADGNDGAEQSSSYEIGTIGIGKTMTLELEGEGGIKATNGNAAIQDDFKLVLKIKRDRHQ